jgi:hypothetical protein
MEILLSKSTIYLILDVGVYSTIILTINGFIYLLRGHNKFKQKVSYYLLLAGLFEMSFYFTGLNGIINIPLLHLWSLVQLIALLNIYKESINQKLIRFIKTAYLLVFIPSIIFWEGLYQNNSLTGGIQHIILISLSLYTLFSLVQKKSKNIIKSPYFWFNLAVLVYFSVTIFLTILGDLLLNEPLLVQLNFWSINAIFVIVFNILLLLSLWLPFKKATLQ